MPPSRSPALTADIIPARNSSNPHQARPLGKRTLLLLQRCSLPCLLLVNCLILGGLWTLDMLTQFGAHISMQQKWMLIMSLTICSNSAIFMLERSADKHYRQVKRQLKRQAADAESERLATEKMIAILTHEIRNPMQAIVAITQQLRSSPLGSRQRAYLEEFEKSGQHMLVLLEDILGSTDRSGQPPLLHNEIFTLDEILRPIRLTLCKKAHEKGLYLCIDCEPDMSARFYGDSHKLRQILFNLCDNAVKYTRRGEITLRIRTADRGNLQFDIIDTGNGIAKNDREAIFSEFRRANTDTLEPGTGLGLAVSARLARCMGGSLTLHESSARGSCFRLCLPLQALSSQPAETGHHVKQGKTDARAQHEVHTFTLSAQQILVVDDDPLQSSLLCELLQQAASLQSAENGAEALQHFFAGQFTLILMDLHMPVLDGLEAARQIRNWEAARGLKPAILIALTASDEESLDGELSSAGFNATIRKPVTPTALQQQLSQLPTEPRRHAQA